MMGEVILTSELIRAARALLRWEQRSLADASSVSLPTIKRLESEARNFGGARFDRGSTQTCFRGCGRRVHKWRPTGSPIA